MVTVVCIILAFSIVSLIVSFFILIPALVEENDNDVFIMVITFLLFLLILVCGGYLEERHEHNNIQQTLEVNE